LECEFDKNGALNEDLTDNPVPLADKIKEIKAHSY
jgi:hypothetical protein